MFLRLCLAVSDIWWGVFFIRWQQDMSIAKSSSLAIVFAISCVSFAIHSSTPRLCGKCQKNPPAFNKTYSPFIHQGAIRYLINQLKFKGAYKNSRLLGLLLANYLEKNAELPGLIISIPGLLHKIQLVESKLYCIISNQLFTIFIMLG
jgi:hypothetical protein